MSKKEFNEVVKPPLPPQFSLRLNWKQRSELDDLADGQPWASYIKDVIFVRRVRPKVALIDRQSLMKILGALGQSRLASNMNQLAKAANSGSLAVNEEVTKALLEACTTIQWMKATLIEALGLKAHEPDKDEAKPHDPER